MKTRIAVLCPSEIAFRRFMPALQKQFNFEYIGIAYANEKEWFGCNHPNHDLSVLAKEQEKAQSFAHKYGGCVFESYQQLLSSPNIDAIYLPLPPALHFKWGKAVLEHGKHLFMEKPFTTSVDDTVELLSLANQNNVVAYENYMFIHHTQLKEIKEIIGSDQIGTPRLYRMCFGFPQRNRSDFRYNKMLGGGALLDCGGYPIRLGVELLGGSTRVVYSRLSYINEFEVDIAGSVTLENDCKEVAQLAFGMSHEYRCELDVWGSKGSLCAPRVFTANAEVMPQILLHNGGTETIKTIPAFDQFEESIAFFGQMISDKTLRLKVERKILLQSKLVENIKDRENKYNGI